MTAHRKRVAICLSDEEYRVLEKQAKHGSLAGHARKLLLEGLWSHEPPRMVNTKKEKGLTYYERREPYGYAISHAFMFQGQDGPDVFRYEWLYLTTLCQWGGMEGAQWWSPLQDPAYIELNNSNVKYDNPDSETAARAKYEYNKWKRPVAQMAGDYLRRIPVTQGRRGNHKEGASSVINLLSPAPDLEWPHEVSLEDCVAWIALEHAHLNDYQSVEVLSSSEYPLPMKITRSQAS